MEIHRSEMQFPQNEFMQISRELEKFHAIFYRMWMMGKPNFTQETTTAFVMFDKNGDFTYFGINPEFWNKMDFYNKVFVICHECLHVALNHGIRMKNCKGEEWRIVNQAEDIVINHLLLNNFGFDRKKITGWENFCWIDTVFNGEVKALPNQLFEYYFNLIKKNSKKTSSKSLVDDHEKMTSNGEASGEVIKKLNDQLSDDEKKTIEDVINKNYEKDNKNNHAGTQAGSQWCFAVVGKVVKKRKWETVIKKWASKYVKNDFKDIEQWARTNRRFSLITNDLIIPSEMEIEDDVLYDQKIEVWFFQDTSGSCSCFRDRFFKAAMSLPENRFDIKMHCFDTKVYETNLKTKKLYGFGGTSFSCIENYIQSDIKKRKVKYPKAVFVITDGDACDYIYPQYPEAYHWFLSHNSTNHIPSKSSRYMLSSFE